ncbi:MAG: hypothetical protein KBS58_00425 [Bacteroidales bacterium]|nr:hypothetical protein [Candidatus Cacconaster equi]
MNKLFKVLLHPGPDRGILDYFESHNKAFERKVGLSYVDIRNLTFGQFQYGGIQTRINLL